MVLDSSRRSKAARAGRAARPAASTPSQRPGPHQPGGARPNPPGGSRAGTKTGTGTGSQAWAGAGIAVHLGVTVGAGTLLGLDDEPAELAGYGPIPADTARELAADATWRRLLTDPATGALLDYGRTTYRPPANLRPDLKRRAGEPRSPAPKRSGQRSHARSRGFGLEALRASFFFAVSSAIRVLPLPHRGVGSLRLESRPYGTAC